jgi:hypothetical protein
MVAHPGGLLVQGLRGDGILHGIVDHHIAHAAHQAENIFFWVITFLFINLFWIRMIVKIRNYPNQQKAYYPLNNI